MNAIFVNTVAQQTIPLTVKEQQFIIQLSSKYKAPLRNILGEAEEAVQNTISNLIHEMMTINNLVEYSNGEIIRLQKLLRDNKIDFNIVPPVEKIETIKPITEN